VSLNFKSAVEGFQFLHVEMPKTGDFQTHNVPARPAGTDLPEKLIPSSCSEVEQKKRGQEKVARVAVERFFCSPTDNGRLTTDPSFGSD